LIQLDIRFNKKLSKLASLRQISRKKDKMISTKAICRKSKPPYGMAAFMLMINLEFKIKFGF